MKKIKPFFLYLIVVLLVAGCQKAQLQDTRPNVIIILTDDQGYHDMGCAGNEMMVTPNIDKMAAEGIRFTDCYAAAATCTPSRAGLLTGCYPPRVGLYWVLFPGSKAGLNPYETTMAEMLKTNGYSTALAGKWHLGDHQQVLPNNHGFDEYFGIPYSNGMLPGASKNREFPPLPLYRNNDVLETNPDQSQFTKRFTEFSTGFIRQHKSDPFFLMLAHPMPHVPLAVSDDFKGKSGNGLYADVIMEIDWSVGEILQTLKEEGIDDNTLVIFTSDNGPWLEYGDHAGSAHPLRNGKFSTFEGGSRVPCIMWWPDHLPGNSVNTNIISAVDYLPTIANITGSDLPDRPIDGQNRWDVMTGHVANDEGRHFYFEHKKLEAIRVGNRKVHFQHRYRVERPGTNGKPGGFEWQKIDTALFDLQTDIGESNNLYQTPDEEYQDFKALYDSMMRSLEADNLF